MQSLGVVSPVHDHTPWCTGMVDVLKRSGSFKICVDLKPLNESVLSEVHPIPTMENILAQLSGASIFTKLDQIMDFGKSP